MKALVTTKDELRSVTDHPEPSPAAGEVKVRIHTASVTSTDQAVVDGHMDLFLTLARAKSPVRTGLEFAGVVTQDSAKFKQGDQVFGYVSLLKGPKTHQEYICVNENFLAPLPKDITMEQGAGIAIAGQTSLVALRQLAKLKPGQSILIVGASGGVGAVAVQIATQMGAKVTAMAGPGQGPFLSALGADTVLDYTQQTIASLTGAFDVVLDLSCVLKFREVRHLMTKRGLFIPADPALNLKDFIGNLWRRQKVGYLLVDKGHGETLKEVSDLVVSGRVKLAENQVYPWEDYVQAFERLGQKGRNGRIILRVAAA